MRLYKKIKSLSAGATASMRQKGGYFINQSSVSSAEFEVQVLNYDGSLTGLTFSLPAAPPSNRSPIPAFILPMPFMNYTVVSGSVQGYELY